MAKTLDLTKLIDIEACANLTKLSISTLRKMCMRKQIPHHKIGRSVRFYTPEIEKWVEINRAA